MTEKEKAFFFLTVFDAEPLLVIITTTWPDVCSKDVTVCLDWLSPEQVK